ncbi:hypothetical protein P8452_31626 [Trifolium repens]|nr:hypothetical protein P8452_31626 [Trifolium repens]
MLTPRRTGILLVLFYSHSFNCIFNLIRSHSHYGRVKSLTLSNFTLQCLNYAKDTFCLLPSFHNLTHLDVFLASTFLTSEVLADILHKTPKLKVLHISKGYYLFFFDVEGWTTNSLPYCRRVYEVLRLPWLWGWSVIWLRTFVWVSKWHRDHGCLSNYVLQCLTYAKDTLHLLPSFDNLMHLDVFLGYLRPTTEAFLNWKFFIFIRDLTYSLMKYIWSSNSLPSCFKSSLKLCFISNFRGYGDEIRSNKIRFKNLFLYSEVRQSGNLIMEVSWKIKVIFYIDGSAVGSPSDVATDAIFIDYIANFDGQESRFFSNGKIQCCNDFN